MRHVAFILILSLFNVANTSAQSQFVASVTKMGLSEENPVHRLMDANGTIFLFRSIVGPYQEGFPSFFLGSQSGHYSYSLHPDFVIPQSFVEAKRAGDVQTLEGYRAHRILIASGNIWNSDLTYKFDPSSRGFGEQQISFLSLKPNILLKDLNQHWEVNVHHSRENVIVDLSLNTFYEVFQSMPERFTMHELVGALFAKACAESLALGN